MMITRTIGTRLCRTDTVMIVERGTRSCAGAVTLNRFVPYRLSR